MEMSIQRISDLGQLSAVSYEDFGPDTPLAKNSVLSGNFQIGEESYFLNSSYTVIDYTSTDTDMQALLLKKNGTNEYVIAFRGTEPTSAKDWLADGLTGLINYNPQVSDALTFVQNMMATYSISADQLTLTGHSLGGILTQAVGAELHIQGYAYNPYGANILSSLPASAMSYYAILGKVLEILGLGEQNDPWVKDNLLTISYQDNGLINGDVLSNLATEFSEFVAGNDHLGGVLPIFGENVGLMGGHSMATLNAAIQHYNEILVHFTETTTMNDLSLAYILSGEDGYNRTEAIFADLNITGTPDHSLSLDILAAIDSDGEIAPFSPSDIKTRAQSDIAYRYALVNLNPFAVVGANDLYDSFNLNGELDIFDPATGDGQLSDKYLTYRAEMLSFLIEKNINDGYNESTIFFEDKATGEAVFRAELNAPLERTVVFGSNQGDVLEGTGPTPERPTQGDRDDFLFGMGGNDTLNGYGGIDWLEGGKGRDTLNGGAGNDTFTIQGTDTDYDIFNGGDDNDTIQGSIGNDTIRVDSLSLADNSIEVIDGGDGNDSIAGTGGNNTIDLTGITVRNIERIEGGGGQDTLTGTNGNDVLYGGTKDAEEDHVVDTLKGGVGNDEYHIGNGDIINDSDHRGTIWLNGQQLPLAA